MAKNFENSNSVNLIKSVAKTSNETANVIQVKMIKNENLIDYPKNNENTSDTIDLEKSMKEIGFTDPIEVTTFNTDADTYMIVSGHRRRCAGVKVGIKTFPCIVKNFDSENDLRNYVLLSNSQRDSAKDPLLFCKRYKMHEEYLKESGFEGSYRHEIATRLGLSVAQADRYKQFNKIILPVWDLVRDEKVGMSSVLGMAAYLEKEQEEILDLLKNALEQNIDLTRKVCEKIINGYRDCGKDYKQEIEKMSTDELLKTSFAPTKNSLNSFDKKDNCFDSNEKIEETLSEEKKPIKSSKQKSEAAEKVHEVYILEDKEIATLVKCIPELLEKVKQENPYDYLNLQEILKKLKKTIKQGDK